MNSFRAQGASPGLAIGTIQLMRPNDLYDPPRNTITDIEKEVLRYEKAQYNLLRQIEAESEYITEIGGGTVAMRLTDQRVLLESSELLEDVAAVIRQESCNAEYALGCVIRELIDMCNASEDRYAVARIDDLRDVRHRLILHMQDKYAANVHWGVEPVIIAAPNIGPDQLSSLSRDIVTGIITQEGAAASHAMIIARSMGIPAITGLGGNFSRLETGDTCILDGDSGCLIVNPDLETRSIAQKSIDEQTQRHKEWANMRNMASVTQDGYNIHLLANVQRLEDMHRVNTSGAEGVGLFRTELIYMNRRDLPDEQELTDMYTAMVRSCKGKPMIMRTVDIGGEKVMTGLPFTPEPMSQLGLRGVRVSLKYMDIFKTQMRAMIRSAQYGDVRIMVPMVCYLREIQAVRAVLDECHAELEKKTGRPAYKPPLGMMIETPAAGISAEIFANEVDFFSIGTNDLTQYVLAAGRDNGAVADIYSPYHPALLRVIRNVCRKAVHAGIPVGICGEAAAEEALIPMWIGMGVYELSMAPDSILSSRAIVRALNHKSARMLVAQVCEKTKETEKVIEVLYRYFEAECGRRPVSLFAPPCG